jgi:hypothetical protein
MFAELLVPPSLELVLLQALASAAAAREKNTLRVMCVLLEPAPSRAGQIEKSRKG